MKIAASTYSFSSLMGPGGFTQQDLVKKTKDMGFDAIEFVELLAPAGETPAGYAARLREECEKQGMPVSNFTFGADFLNGCGGDMEAEIARVEAMIDLAEILGAKSVRHDAALGGGKCRDFYAVLPALARACRRVSEYAAQKGIRTMVENHGFFCQDSDRVAALHRAVGFENFGLLVDMGNFLCADEDPAAAVSRVAPLAFYVHAKDFHIKDGNGPSPGAGFMKTRGANYIRGAVLGHGNVPVARCLGALSQAGFDGYVAIEFEGMENAETAMAIGLENLRRYLAFAD